MKNNGRGKSSVLTEEDYKKIKEHLPSARDRLLIAIAFYTGERMGAIVQLTVDCVYADTRAARPLDQITFPHFTRKSKRDTRQVPIHPTLREMLCSYQPPLSGWLFPSPRNSENHIDFSTADKMLRHCLDRAGLEEKGISLHSFRRTFITQLHRQGLSLKSIQAITKHRSISALAEYVEVDENYLKESIFKLPQVA